VGGGQRNRSHMRTPPDIPKNRRSRRGSYFRAAQVVRNGSVMTSVSGTSYTDTAVSASTAYSYQIVAYDARGRQYRFQRHGDGDHASARHPVLRRLRNR